MPTKPSKQDVVMATLAALLDNNAPMGEVTITRSPSEQILLPEGMTNREAIIWLERKEEADNTRMNFVEMIEGFPLDASRALSLAVKEMFGFKSVSDFWPQSIALQIDADRNTEQIYMGAFQVPNIDGDFKTEWGGPMTLKITAKVKQKDQAKVKNLMTLTREKLQTQSVYRGQAFKLRFNPETGFPADPIFMRVGMLGQLQVNQDTLDLLQGAVWTPIERTARCRANQVPLKRAALLEGPFGTGKTLFAAETATIATKHRWSFIYLDDIRWLAQAYNFAEFYAPAVLFAEDIDTMVRDGEIPESIRNTIDGVSTKRSDILMVLTTNHPDRLPKSILRPGRLDVVIPFRAPDPRTAEILVRQYAGKLLPAEENLVKVGHQLNGRIPAVIREVVERAKLHMIHRSEVDELLTSADLEIAATSMNHQLSLLEAEKKQGASLVEIFGKALGAEMRKAAVETALADGLNNLHNMPGYTDEDSIQAAIEPQPVSNGQ